MAKPWTAACQASLSFTISQSLLKRICIESVMPSNDLILIPFSSCQSFPTPRGSLVSRLFTPVDQSIQASDSASVLPMNIQGWFPLGLTGLISLLSKGLVFSSENAKASILWCSAFFMVQLSHLYMTNRKAIALTIWTLAGKVMSLLFNMLSMLCYAKSLQLWPTLCDPIDGSPTGSPIPGILQARTLEWVAISFSNAWKGKVKVKSSSRVQLLATP